jgi:predicted phosphate transport protein (TIGR00153 family)
MVDEDGLEMAKKKGETYFDTFVELVSYSCRAADLLKEILYDFNAEMLPQKMKEMHEIEHGGDEARHRMIKRLAREFITPIDREDIVALADTIDTVTDTIEDVLMRTYMFNISKVTVQALKMTDVIVKCCNALKTALDEFSNFRKSSKLHDLVVEVNRLEEEGDALYMDATRKLYVECDNYKELAAWDTIYHYLEKCCDSCEDVADAIESVIMKNS